jgi:hypothetical protein
MLFRVAVPKSIQMRLVCREYRGMRQDRRQKGDIYYIGGTDVLPPPLRRIGKMK